MCESKTRMITNKSINIIGHEAYLNYKLSAVIRDKVRNQTINEKITYIESPQNPIDLA